MPENRVHRSVRGMVLFVLPIAAIAIGIGLVPVAIESAKSKKCEIEGNAWRLQECAAACSSLGLDLVDLTGCCGGMECVCGRRPEECDLSSNTSTEGRER